MRAQGVAGGVFDQMTITMHRRVRQDNSARALRMLLGLGVFFALLPASHAALAQGRLDAQYEATLAGIPVGKGAWSIEIGDDAYSAQVSGGTSGLLKAFAGGSG